MNKLSLALTIIGVVVLSALFFMLRPSPTAPAPSSTAAPLETTTPSPETLTHAPAPEPTAEPDPGVLRLEIRAGHLVEGPATIQVAQGRQLELELVSDVTAEWHLHGYDIHAELQPGTPTRITLDAQHAGRFEHELHGGGAHGGLGVIEVYPATQ